MTITATPDFSNDFVCLATPAGSGDLHHTYVRGKDETVKAVESFGGKCEWMLLPGCSDLGLARARILSSFLANPRYTHLMMIDSDMGWNGIDVARLLNLREDFIGAAGPMKQYPLKFATVVMDENMQAIPITDINWDVGTLEVHEVGMAFVLITRACAQKMTEFYSAELSFGAPGFPDSVALFDPIIRNGRRYSEDFAFCRRWRDIGGRVVLLSDVVLSHSGGHTFKGCLMDQFLQNIQQNGLKAA